MRFITKNKLEKNYLNEIKEIYKKSLDILKKVSKLKKTQKIEINDVKSLINQTNTIIFLFDELKQNINNDEKLKDKQKESLLDFIEIKSKDINQLDNICRQYENQMGEYEKISKIKKDPLVVEVKEKNDKK